MEFFTIVFFVFFRYYNVVIGFGKDSKNEIR